MRCAGVGWAAAVLVLDLAKGAVAVLLAQTLYQAGPPGSTDGWPRLPAWRPSSVTTGRSSSASPAARRGDLGGGLLVISPWTLAVIAPLMALVIWQSRYVSLGSVVAAAAAPAVTAVLAAIGVVGWAAVAYALAAGLLVIGSHGDNLRRLRDGTERRIGEREAASSNGRG